MLLLEVVNSVGPHPSKSQSIVLYEVVAFFGFLGELTSHFCSPNPNTTCTDVKQDIWIVHMSQPMHVRIVPTVQRCTATACSARIPSHMRPFDLLSFGTACLLGSCLLDPCIQAHRQPRHEVAHERSSGLVAALLLLHWHWSELLRAGKKTLRSHASGNAERGERLPLLDEAPLLASHSPRQALALLCLQSSAQQRAPASVFIECRPSTPECKFIASNVLVWLLFSWQSSEGNTLEVGGGTT